MVLREEEVDDLDDDDLDGALDLLEGLNIDDVDDVQDVDAARDKLWSYLVQQQTGQVSGPKIGGRYLWTARNVRLHLFCVSI